MAVIVKFLNYKDKGLVANAAMAKEEYFIIIGKLCSSKIYKQQKCFDSVKHRLWAKAIRYGIVFLARLKVSHSDRSYIFDNAIYDTPAVVEYFLEKLGNGMAAVQR